MDNADLLSHSQLHQESTEHFQAERDFPLTCDDDGFRKTELFSDYQPGPSHSLAPVVMQNAKHNPGLSSATTDEFRESHSLAPVVMQNAKHNPGLSTATTDEFRESEPNQRPSDLLPLQPASPIIDHGRSRGRMAGRTGRPQERYPAFSLVELLHCCTLIGPELQSGEIFSCTERSYYRRP